ncbi:hypothetical protein SSP24_55340 [Streptomyces spinoverrucosus]|uniref:Uncharacterized protein n=1 Tax=Streptomyces spinoverrucosus TaxID=284043 RepID=A0A4Y3VQC4_9ACTN|nr:hypothetical protein [Streptomyces spinoverrucosus]GEC07879.1 hypothetical protein SSP24_55340 [Streptomyces spinoverrucosus]GHB86160.1 hypothetical protein GCM10010397_67200 [Streptomyces spinoverrucosus]
MGERQIGGGSPGRRRVHPYGFASGHGHVAGPKTAPDDAALEALLSAAVLGGHRPDTEGEQRAVAAFRAARDAGAHRARTRRRDDWRPREQRRLVLPVKTTLSLFIASLALGGVAVAAIGSSDSPDGPADDRGRPTPPTSAPDLPGAEPSSAASDAAPAKPGHPSTAQDTEARCRAYDQVEGRGNALDATAWQRLVTEAGGEERVAVYCAEQLARAAAKGRPSRAATPGGGAANATNGAGDNGADNAERGAGNANTGAGNANSGTGDDQAEKATSNGKKN